MAGTSNAREGGRQMQATGRRTGLARTKRPLAIIAILAQVFATLAIVVGSATPASAGAPAVMFGYVPLPADQMQGAFESINSAADTTLDFTVGITVANTGAIIYYDQWEDGYEPDISNPVQSTTQVWGDGNPANGDASTVCSTCTGDLLTAGDVFVLRNDIPTPRDPSDILWDGRDKVASTRGFSLTAGGWTKPLGSVLAGAVSAFDTSHYGTAFVVPVGQDTPVPTGASPPFEYTGASIMASQDNTLVQVDANHDGTFEQSQTINEGEAMFVNGGLDEGARIKSSKPVQVHIMAGDVGATYEAHFFTLFPTAALTNSYIDPVASSVVNQETIVYLFNPNASGITITPTCTSCSGTIAVAPNTSTSFTTPLGEAVKFTSGGPVFTAVGAAGSQSGAGGGTDDSSTFDWGWTLVPANILTTQVVLGWAPGASDVPPSSDTYDPVWATTFAATTLHVDFDGDPTTGSLGADCIGQHDLEIPVAALASTRITDPSDNSMTGARIYTCDGTAVAAAWGEDPSTAPSGSPGLDAGYSVIPTTTMLVSKTSSLAIDSNGDGKFGPGDTMQYSVAVTNAGDINFTNVKLDDALPAGLTYVPGSTVFDDGVSTTPVADDATPPAATAFPLDEGGLGVPDIAQGTTAFVRFRTQIDNPYPSSNGIVTNTVDVTSDQGSGTSTDQQQLATADLSLTKTETGHPTFVGQNAVFHVTVHNSGPDTAPAVVVADALPAGTTYLSDNPSQGNYAPFSGQWSVGDLANGASATIDITARMDATSVQNFAQVSASGAVDPDSQPAEDALDAGHPPNQDDEDSVVVNVQPRADLSLNKTRIAGPDVNGDTTYRIAVSNAGPSDATGVQVTELPPTGSTYVSSIPSQGSFDNTSGVWNIGTIANGTTKTLDVIFNVPSFPATNYAEVSAVNEADPDSQPAEDLLGPGHPPNQDDEGALTVTLSADLSLTKTETASPQFVGDTAQFDVTVSNAGPDVANNVQVTDLLPTGLSYVSHNTSQGTYVPGTGLWNVGALTVNGSETLHINARVTTPGTLNNTAEITASGAPDPDSTPGNHNPAEDDQASASVTTTGGSLGDLVWYDANGDGNRDAGEPGIPGVQVTVVDAGPNGTLGDGDDVSLPPVTTDSSGAWTVTGLGPGPYRVSVDPSTLPAGVTVPTHDLDGTATANTADTSLTSGQNRTDADFGYKGTASVGDTIFLDVNGNGVADPGEGISGVGVNVTWAGFDGVLGTSDDVTTHATTNASGVWLVNDLPPGLVQVQVDLSSLPPGVANSVDPDGGDDGVSKITLGVGQNDPNQDFGFAGTGVLGQTIFNDVNKNGKFDTGEGIPSVTVQVVWAGVDGILGTSDDATYSAITNSTGSWGVGDLPAGQFRVSVDTATLPSGAKNTVDPDGNDDSTSLVTLTTGQSNLLQNFGYTVPVTPAGQLAFTGSNLVGTLLLWGVSLVAAGVALYFLTRKRWALILQRLRHREV